MPTNHGIYRKLPTTAGQRITAAEAIVFRYGLLRVLQALKTGPFLADAGERQRAAQLEHHFKVLCQRFVFTLQHLNKLMQDLIQCASHDGQVSVASMETNLHAECLADHLLTYLNSIVDDAAIVISLATGFTSRDPIDNMGKLRSREHRNDPALAPVKKLLDDLDVTGSWWELAFKKEHGARQLLVHNQHLVGFNLRSVPGGQFEANAAVMSPFAQNTFACRDFFGLLRDILTRLFEWLDDLEGALTSHLQTKSSAWQPNPACPVFLLPVGNPGGETRYDPSYFPVPLCEGADPLPWTVSVPEE